jgi:Domain of unknown function (DUF4412)
MTRLAFVATAVLATAPMFAGVKIVSENTDLATKKVTTDTILLDANRMRLESDDGRAFMFLTDGGRNRIVMLDKARNTYQEIDQQTMDQMGQMMSGASAQMSAQMEAAMKNMTPEQRKMMEQAMKGKMPQAAAPAAAPKTVYTAKGSGSVNGFSCTKYEGDQGGQKEAEVCAAVPAQLKLSPADMQIFEKMREFSAGLLSSLAKSPVKVNVPTGSLESGYEGFPIQRTDFENGQATKRGELKSITRANFTDADFSLGDAKKVEMPIPGAPKGKQR